MATRALFLLLFALIGAASALVPPETLTPSAPKALSDLRETIVKALGLHAEGMKVSGFDPRDAEVGQSLAYEFQVEIDNKIIPLRLLEDVKRWDPVDLLMFRSDEERDGAEKALVDPLRQSQSRALPVLPSFQLAGPMELWIQDGDDMRVALPHDVDAGKLKKVMLSDGAVVTVKGARSVILRHPLELPLPFNHTNNPYRPTATGLLTLGEALRHAARNSDQPLLSLRIVSPTSLTSTPSFSPNDKLKLKRLAPGLVELSSRSVPAVTEEDDEQLTLPPNTMWPFTSINGSDMTLCAFEELLASVLGKKRGEEGSFKLLNAEVSARKYLKTSFLLEQRISEKDLPNVPSWKTNVETVSDQFEVLARVEDSGDVITESVKRVTPPVVDSFADNVQRNNVSMSKVPIVNPPQDFFWL